MKNSITLLFSTALIVVSSGCQKQPDETSDNGGNPRNYVLYAEDVTTKTVTDASFNVSWSDGDNLAVYTWPEGTDLPTSNDDWRASNPVLFVAEPGAVVPRPFKLSDTDDVNSLAVFEYAARLNAFKNRFGNATSSLNWGVIYPGTMSNASMPGLGIVVFGDGTKVRSHQTGNNSKTHLAYQDVLWGTTAGTEPTVSMTHLGTMMEYTVRNSTSTAFTVTGIKISVPDASIGGEFRVNVFDGTIQSCMTSLTECTLSVENGTPISAGGSAKFYQVLAPFSLNAGSTVTMTVETTKGNWSKEMTLSAPKAFESGKRNTATLKVDNVVYDTPVVKIENNKLYVNGKEFYIKGAALNGDNKTSAGKQEFWKEAKQAGANTVRLYSVNTLSETVLDDLVNQGIYVNLGLWMPRECEGYDYNDAAARKTQISSVKKIVDKYKGHPAILMWCIGNELDQNNKVDGSGTISLNVNVWKDVNEISQYIHSVDGRPTTTALTSTWSKTINEINTYASDLDILSINAYDPGIYDVHSSLKSQNFSRPYIISELGQLGTWEASVKKTEWGCLIESTGTEKAADYKRLYNECILPHANEGCLGSYVFLWGYQSHGDVLTWYAMYDQFQKYSLPAVDVMAELWTGISVSNPAPKILNYKSLTINGLTAEGNVQLNRGEIAEAVLVASEPNGGALTYSWQLIEDKRLSEGTLMPDNPVSAIGAVGNAIKFKAPEKAGAYRLIVYARNDANNKTDMASFPFYVTDNPCSYSDGIDNWNDGNNINF